MLLVQQQDVIAPGGYSEVQVEIPTDGVEGVIDKRFLVRTDANEKSLHDIELHVRGEIRTFIIAIPSQLHFGIIPGLQSGHRPLYLRSSFVDLADKLIGVESDNPFVSFSILDRKPGLLSCQVSVSPLAPAGDFTAQLTFRFNFTEHPEYKVFVRGRCLGGDLTVAPTRFVLRKSSDANEFLALVRIESRSRKPFHLHFPKPDSSMELSWKKTDKRGVAYDVTLRVKDAKESILVPKIVDLETDQRDQPIVKIPVVLPATK